MRRILLLIAALGILLTGCEKKQDQLKVAATSVPHAEILQFIAPDLEDDGVFLKVVEIDDYNTPNRLLAEKQVDANFFQHLPFLNRQNELFGYDLVLFAKVHLEPLGLYSDQVSSIEAIPENAEIAIPSDPTNEARALDLLADAQLITLKKGSSLERTVNDIETNPRNIKVIEVDAPFLPRALPDVTAAVIPSNFALQADLNPLEDALFLEKNTSPYVNIVAIRQGDEKRSDLKLLRHYITSDETQEFIKKRYKGALIPTAPSKGS